MVDKQIVDAPAEGAFIYLTRELTLRSIESYEELLVKMGNAGAWLEITCTRQLPEEEGKPVRFVIDTLRLRKANILAYG